MIECTVANKRFVDHKGIRKGTKDWTYPLSFLDFETIGYAIPRYNGQRPYQQIPFQFSCHVKEWISENLAHFEYLHLADSDPRENICRALLDVVPESGSVVAYNMAFESRVLSSLAEEFPKYKKGLTNIAARLVDPLPIIRAHVYDPHFCGRFSLKSVGPALLGEQASYQEMDVGNGTEAQLAYLAMINAATDEKCKEELRRNLVEYCKKDTLVTVHLVEWLFAQTVS